MTTTTCRYCGRELRPYGERMWCPDRVHCRHTEPIETPRVLRRSA